MTVAAERPIDVPNTSTPSKSRYGDRWLLVRGTDCQDYDAQPVRFRVTAPPSPRWSPFDLPGLTSGHETLFMELSAQAVSQIVAHSPRGHRLPVLKEFIDWEVYLSPCFGRTYDLVIEEIGRPRRSARHCRATVYVAGDGPCLARGEILGFMGQKHLLDGSGLAEAFDRDKAWTEPPPIFGELNDPACWVEDCGTVSYVMPVRHDPLWSDDHFARRAFMPAVVQVDLAAHVVAAQYMKGRDYDWQPMLSNLLSWKAEGAVMLGDRLIVQVDHMEPGTLEEGPVYGEVTLRRIESRGLDPHAVATGKMIVDIAR